MHQTIYPTESDATFMHTKITLWLNEEVSSIFFKQYHSPCTYTFDGTILWQKVHKIIEYLKIVQSHENRTIHATFFVYLHNFVTLESQFCGIRVNNFCRFIIFSHSCHKFVTLHKIVHSLWGSSFSEYARGCVDASQKGYREGVKLIFVFSVTFRKNRLCGWFLFLELFEQFKNFYLDETLTFYHF